jgi:DNA replication protein DnaC
MGELTPINAISETTLTLNGKRVQRGPAEPAPAPRICEICGASVPALLTVTGYWVERQCKCERDLRRQKAEKREHRELMKSMSEYTYEGWLGSEFLRPRMVLERAAMRFSQYDANRQSEYERLRRIYQKAAPEQKEHMQFIIAEFERDRATWRNALDQAQRFAENPRGVFLIYGGYGLGKTHLLASICNALRHRESPVSSLFVLASHFFQAIYGKMSGDGEVWELIRRASTAKLLVIDDLDKASPKDFRQEVLFQIIDERVTAGLSMAVSTNKMASLAEYIGDAAYSRLMQRCIPVEMTGKDYRLNMVEKK